jgi:hypothetical protein
MDQRQQALPTVVAPLAKNVDRVSMVSSSSQSSAAAISSSALLDLTFALLPADTRRLVLAVTVLLTSCGLLDGPFFNLLVGDYRVVVVVVGRCGGTRSGGGRVVVVVRLSPLVFDNGQQQQQQQRQRRQGVFLFSRCHVACRITW